MGNCCGSSAVSPHGMYRNTHDRSRLPKFIIIPEDAALMYLDSLPTPESMAFKDSLKYKFPNLEAHDTDKIICHRIETMKERKCYIVVAGNIRRRILSFLLAHPKVRAIYFCVGPSNVDHEFQSYKIKGVFDSQMELEKIIYYDVRSDDIH